jgi:hypothetical protein
MLQSVQNLEREPTANLEHRRRGAVSRALSITMEHIMNKCIAVSVLALSLLAPGVALAQSTTATGAATGAATGGAVGGPVGAVVGGTDV